MMRRFLLGCFLVTVLSARGMAAAQTEAKQADDILNDPDIALARDTINKTAAGTPSAPGIYGLCITGWKQLAFLGDPSAIEKLREHVAKDTKGYGIQAQHALLVALGKPEVDRLIARAASRTLPLNERVCAAVVCTSYVMHPYFAEMPRPFDDAFHEVLEEGKLDPSLSALHCLAGYQCSARTGQFARDYLKACLSSHPKQIGPPADPCLAEEAIKASQRAPYHDSDGARELLSALVDRAPWDSVREAAAMALAAEGKPEVAKTYFAGVLAKAQDPAERIRLATRLVTVGDAASMDILREGLSSPDQEIRCAACRGYLALGDDSFIEQVVDTIGAHVFEGNPTGKLYLLGLTEAVSDESKTPGQRNAAAKLLTALAERRQDEAVRYEVLGALLACPDEHVRSALARSLKSLSAPLPRSPLDVRKEEKDTYYPYMRHVNDAIVVMRCGQPQERQAALERVKSLYANGHGYMKGEVIRALATCIYPEIKSFLASVIRNPPEKGGESTRMYAAEIIPAVVAGRLCE